MRPCEQNLATVIRKELAKILASKGMKKKEIAKILEVTPAAVSQYIKDKRGKQKIDKKLRELLEAEAERILLGENFDLCKTCRRIFGSLIG